MLNEKDISIMMHDLDEALKDSADKQAVYENLSDLKKTRLAAEENKVDGGSESRRARIALDSEPYREFLKGLCAAREMFLGARARCVYAQKRVDVWQTLMANRREEIKKGL
jgi:hypothetical protein